jgi:hypothetical protein
MSATATAPARTKRDAASKKAIPVGISPRVSLMPPELGERTKALATQRSLRLALVGVVLLAVIGVAAAWYYAFTSTVALTAEQDRTNELLLEQQTYADVQRTVKTVELGEAALRVGGSTEIDWQDYLGLVQASLPAGVVLDSFSVDASTATTQYPQSNVPLQGARVATLQFTATSDTLPSIPDWLNALRELPGDVDANPGTVAISDGGRYTAGITMHIDAQAYTNRLLPDTKDDAADGAASDDATDTSEETAE